MAISSNSKWNYGTILTPDKMDNIERSLDQIVMGAINKRTIFSDNNIIEYFGEVIGSNQNQKITVFEDNGNITEYYDLYFKAGDNDNINVINKQYVKITEFNDDSITETLEVVK